MLRIMSISLAFSTFLLISISTAQPAATTAVPALINYSGTLHDHAGSVAASSQIVGVTFAIYKQQDGGAPVWLETQNVTLDASGHYSVVLGSTTATGLPGDLFSQQEQRWLGVQVQGEAEQARVLLVSVPYALKAVEADKLAGHSASEFVTTDNLQTAVQQQLQQQSGAASTTTTTNTSRKSTNSGITSPAIDAATDFIDTTANQVVLVQQNGTGVALSASAPSNTAIVGASKASVNPYVVAGVQAITSVPAGFGLYARQISPTAPGVAPTALYAQSDSPYGAAIRAWEPYGSTRTYGIIAGAASIGGTAIQATETAISGATYGMVATVNSPAGTGVLIQNNASGIITGPLIRAQANNTTLFSVDGSGNVNTALTYQIQGDGVLSIGRSDADMNLFLGAKAGSGGNVNTFAGYFAGHDTTSGVLNTFSGALAGSRNTTGGEDTFSGVQAGYQNTIGSGDTFFGYLAGFNNTTGSNDIYIGNLGPNSGSESNTIRIGGDLGLGYGPQTATYIAGVYGATASSGIAVYINSSGQLGTLSSSRRFKEQIRDMGDSTNALMKLRPVTFLYRSEYDKGPRTLQYGLIAEEVAEVYPDLVDYEPDGKPYTVKYQYLTTMLLNEMQKQYHRAEAEAKVITLQQDQIQSLQKQNQEFQQRLSRLEALVGAQVKIAEGTALSTGTQ